MPEELTMTIRKAAPEDADVFLSLIDALADYEKLQRPDAEARERLIRDATGPEPRIEAYLAAYERTAVAYAIIFETYSSFLALPTLYLEDIFVLPEFRGRKIGLRLFLAMSTLARDRGCGRMEWTVLHWNTPAIDFYKQLGADHMDEWFLYRLSSESLDGLPRVEF